MKIQLPSFVTNRFNRVESKRSIRNTEKLPESSIAKTDAHAPSSSEVPQPQPLRRKATVFSELNPIPETKKLTIQKSKAKAAEFFKALLRNVVDLKKLIQATAIYNQHKKACINLNQTVEQKGLLGQLKGSPNLGDLHRFKVTIENDSYDPSGAIEEINQAKEERLRTFCNNDQLLFDNIIKTAQQGLPASISLVLTPAFFSVSLKVGSTESSANQGLKEIIIKRDLEGNIHCTVQVPFPILPQEREEHPLLTIKASVTVVIPEEDLRNGKVDSAVFTSSVELL